MGLLEPAGRALAVALSRDQQLAEAGWAAVGILRVDFRECDGTASRPIAESPSADVRSGLALKQGDRHFGPERQRLGVVLERPCG